MSSTPELCKAIEMVKMAVEEDNNHKYEKALELYDESIKIFIHAMKFEGYNEEKIKSIRIKYAQYVNRAEKLRDYIKRRKEEKTHEEEDDESEEENDKNNENKKLKFLCCLH